MGALISKEHLTKVMNYVKFAKEEGCSILCGHGVEKLDVLPEKNKAGYFMRPTVITNVSDKSKLMQEEVFGPVTCIVPFKTEEEVRGCSSLLCRHGSRWMLGAVCLILLWSALLVNSFKVVKRANDVQYGLCACVWSENSGISHRVAQTLDVSSISGCDTLDREDGGLPKY